MFYLVDDVLSQRLEDLESIKASLVVGKNALPESAPSDAQDEGSSGSKTECDQEAPSITTTEHNRVDVRTRFVQESIQILTSLQSNLMLIVKDRGMQLLPLVKKTCCESRNLTTISDICTRDRRQ